VRRTGAERKEQYQIACFYVYVYVKREVVVEEVEEEEKSDGNCDSIKRRSAGLNKKSA
jgi:hypothetical protein